MVRTYAPRKPGISPVSVYGRHGIRANYTINSQYVDGLGRAIQQSGYRQAVDGKDLITPVYYDEFNRIKKEYLPYPGSTAQSDGFHSNARKKQYDFYYLGTSATARSAYAYSEYEFEPSPLNWVLATAAPGEGSNLISGKVIKQQISAYNSSIHGQLPVWSVDDANRLVQNGYHQNWTLHVSTTQDENGYYMDQITNREGQTLFKVTYLEDLTPMVTSYVYDSFGNLRFVLPPEASKAIDALGTSFSWTAHQSLIDTWAFQCHYDARKRMIAKRVPGMNGWTKMKYDKRDRLVLTQDPNLSLTNKWLFTKYDALNRPILIGFYVQSNETTINNALSSQTVFHESRNSSGIGYTNLSFPTSINSSDYLSLTYYDTYDFLSLAGFSGDYDYSQRTQSCVSIPQGNYCAPETNDLVARNLEVSGHVTGMRTRVLGENNLDKYSQSLR